MRQLMKRRIAGQDDTLWRLAAAKFRAMLDDPKSYGLPRFADQRGRMISATVEFHNRVHCKIACLVYQMLKFDQQGRLDCNAFERQTRPNSWRAQWIAGQVRFSSVAPLTLAKETGRAAGSLMMPRRASLCRATRQLTSLGRPSCLRQPSHSRTSRDRALRVSVASLSMRERIRASVASENS
jgi:hypothetical protein